MAVWLAIFLSMGAIGTWLARGYAVQRDLLDHPGERRSHDAVTPRGGGIAIVVALLAATLALALRDPSSVVLLAGFATGLLLVAGIGWWDDHRPLPAWSRLAVHAVAAAVMSIAVLGAFGEPWLAVAAFVAALALVNVWNFMDGINGLAASQAALVAAGYAGLMSGSLWGWLGVAFVAACAGFLPFNFPRARIFLGDVGSGALGFAVAAFAVVAVGRDGIEWPLALMPLSAFLTDAGWTLLRRVWRREPWWTAHTQHAYQAWARRLGRHTPVTLAYAAWTSTAIGLVILLHSPDSFFMWAVVLSWYTSCAFFWWCLQRRGAGNGRSDGVEWRRE